MKYEVVVVETKPFLYGIDLIEERKKYPVTEADSGYARQSERLTFKSWFEAEEWIKNNTPKRWWEFWR